MLYAATIALSAFLLFVIQPMIAKQILPWFGGAASVWTTCMAFFQVVLVAGYAYGDVLSRRLPLRRQAMIHVALLAASVVVLPVLAPATLKPNADTEPCTRILLLLSVTVGLPYFLLSTTGPLVQAWFARRYQGDRVYRLYALSNAASMLALLAYPAVIEPFIATRAQAISWSAGYAAFALLAGASAVVTWRAAARRGTSGYAIVEPSEISSEAPGDLTVRSAAIVLALAALSSVLLLSITTHMTRDVASMPFLWMLPLLLYLLTFVLCFDGRGWYQRSIFGPIAALLVVAMLGIEVFGGLNLALSMPIHAAGLFAACMVCHGEIVTRRPAPRLLTWFFLMISVGGAAGGLLVGIVAPLVFPANFELPFALCATALIVYVATPGRMRFVAAAALVGGVALTTLYVRGVGANALAYSRNFYGTLRVTRSSAPDSPDAMLRLSHGVILHGQQYVSAERRATPTSYFGPTSGIGRTIELLRPRSIRMGIVGLGAGTLAAYGRPGDYVRFYELDPEVERYARTWFHFLEDTEADVEVTIGDARLSLEREPPMGFDLLVVDAFSSDSIPVHLMTREAMSVYLRHLRAGGVIAFHVSNRFLELSPVVRGLATESAMRALGIRDEPKDTLSFSPSRWVIVTANSDILDELAKQRVAEEVAPQSGLRTWSDDYSNLFSVVKVPRELGGF